MTKICQTTLSYLLALLPLPLLGNDQTCNTQITATTPTARFTSSNNGTVLDKYTGLMWKKCGEGQQWNAASHTCNLFTVTYSWQKALQRAQTVNSGAGFAGYKDWRVPNLKELNTLVEEQCNNPQINLRVFPTTPGGFWSSSSLARDGNAAWGVYFGRDGGTYPDSKNSDYQVRLVRSGH